MTEALSILALIVSVGSVLYTAFVSQHISNREVTNAAIADYYQAMRDLTMLQMQEWQLAHLFEVEENYSTIADMLRQVAPPPGDPSAVSLALKERAAALSIFGLYEHVIYQLGKAEADRDQGRIEFLTDAADYFADRLLPNPRLRYLWSKDGGNLECEFEVEARAHYRQRVGPAHYGWDDRGPYGAP